MLVRVFSLCEFHDLAFPRFFPLHDRILPSDTNCIKGFSRFNL